VQTCANCKTQSPDDARFCPRCGADLQRMATMTAVREKLQANDRVSLIRISIMADCCPACAALQGAHPKDSVPVLPVPACSHALGCRCHYEPVLTEVYP
jgi:hypothetical protein